MEAGNDDDALSSSSDCHRPISAQQIKKNTNNPLRASTAPSFSSTAPSSTNNMSSNRTIMNNNNEQNVKVVARIRPLSTKEINEKSLECITANTNNSTIHVTTTDNTSSSNSNSSLNNDNKRTFNFDAVYNSNTTQEELYEKTIGSGNGDNNNMISNSIFNGYNATILAYGQTGSGKVCSIFVAGVVCLRLYVLLWIV